ncbi:hypothetical protein P4O66_008117 [Electrophorus voltai]|uniref:Chromo domain-containing protein n=1 Tax=Electrophorus voltai TaxID=2609070 RepID=A0AAD9DYL1_9TELE|nr:hypothetical protein P4O66_008117 [Electrophorus voltai]
MQPGKVEAVTGWPRPWTWWELQRFLGFANFYRCFIKSFNTLARPLMDLLRGKTKQLRWGEAADRAFVDLKTSFSTSPVLQQPDPEKTFIVEVDISDVGVGSVLPEARGEEGKLGPIAYFLRKLSPSEWNYGVGDRELLAMKLTLEEWRHWLEGVRHPFTVITDHKNLEYLQTTKRLNSRQARWSLFFSRFAFRVTYRLGEKNVRADALTQKHHAEAQSSSQEPVIPPSCFLAAVTWDIDCSIEAVNPHPQCPPNWLYVPFRHRRDLIAWAHTSVGTGHLGSTCTTLSARYWWPAMNRDIVRKADRKQEVTESPSSRAFHVSALKPVVEGPLSEEGSPLGAPPLPLEIGCEPPYRLRALLDSQRRTSGLQYLVDWEGYRPEEHCWVPASQVLDPNLIASFYREHPRKPAPC